jgi:hypothetical protein
MLGSSGVLTVSSGTLDRRLDFETFTCPSRNGTIRFVANCMIGAKVANIIVAGSVTILDGVQVKVTGRPVHVLVNFLARASQAYYNGFGGDSSTAGKAIGLGAPSLSDSPPDLRSARQVLCDKINSRSKQK